MVSDMSGAGVDRDAPSNLVATYTPTQIDLTWSNAHPDYTTILIQRMDSLGNPWTEIASITGSSEAYTDTTNIQEGVIYSYRVAAILADGTTQTGWSRVASATYPLPAPTSFVLSMIDEDTAQATWVLNSTFEDTVEITWIGGTLLGGTILLPPGTTFSTAIEPLIPGILYTAQVRVRRGSVDSTWSNQDTLTPIVNAPLNVISVAIRDSVADITWTDNSKFEEGYEIARDGQSLSQVAAGVEYFRDTNATPSATHVYSVRTLSTGSPSIWSDAPPLDMPDPPPAPPADPTDVIAKAVGGTEVDLTWTDNATDETSYTVERSVDGGAYTPVATLGFNSTSYIDTLAQPSTSYQYLVYCSNSAGDSGQAISNQVTTPTGSVNSRLSPYGTPLTPGS